MRNVQHEIIGYQDNRGIWRIAIDGVQHTTDFKSKEDIRMWLHNLQHNGLYPGYSLSF